MAIGREARRDEQRGRVQEEFPGEVAVVMQVLDLLDLAWHDCFGEVAPPQQVIDDLFVAAEGDLRLLIDSAHLAISDWRDLRLRADVIRQRT